MQATRGTALTQPAPAPPAPRKRAGLLAAVAVVAVAADVASKLAVVAHLEGHEPVRLLGGFLTLEASRNSGAAFSFAEGATVVFTAVAVAVVVVIARTARKLRSGPWAVTLGLLLGGAVGNLLDRLFRSPGVGRGAVVDFIHLPHFAVFNVADSCITVGAALAVLLSLRGLDVDGTRKTADQ